MTNSEKMQFLWEKYHMDLRDIAKELKVTPEYLCQIYVGERKGGTKVTEGLDSIIQEKKKGIK